MRLIRAISVRRGRHTTSAGCLPPAPSPPAEEDRDVCLTSVVDGWDHDVEEAELERGRSTGTYRARCGAETVPAALTVPAGRRCHECAALSRSAGADQ